MSEGKFCVEYAKSGRSACSKCKGNIPKDSVSLSYLFKDLIFI